MRYKEFCEKLVNAFSNNEYIDIEIYNSQFKLWFDTSVNGIPEITVYDDKTVIDFDEGTFEFSSSSTMEVEEENNYITFLVDTGDCKIEIGVDMGR